MSRQIQIRRGSALEHNSFIGAIGEITMDTDNKTLRVHDGETVGGTALAKQSEIPDLTNADYVIEWQTPSAENNYTWFRKYKSGWVEQGGVCTTGFTVVLPVDMADNNYCITIGYNQYNENVGTPVVVFYNKTQNGFGLQGRWNGSGTSGINVCWRVAGFSA